MAIKGNDGAQTEIGRYLGLSESRQGGKIVLTARFAAAGGSHAETELDEMRMALGLIGGDLPPAAAVQLREGLTALWLRAEVGSPGKTQRLIQPGSPIFNELMRVSGVELKGDGGAALALPPNARALPQRARSPMDRFEASPA